MGDGTLAGGMRQGDMNASVWTSAARVTALIGPYGSGKTELAIGLALKAQQDPLRPPAAKVAVADVDVLKPYFRSREAEQHLAQAGIEMLAPKGVMGSADLPILPPGIRGLVLREEARVFMDVGGDPVGARALGALSDVVAQAGFELLFVHNRNRPFAADFDSVMTMANQIMGACNLKITGVVANTHMMDETTLDMVRWGLELSRKVATALGVDVRYLAVPDDLAGAEDLAQEQLPVIQVRRHMKPGFMGGVVLNPTRLPFKQAKGSEA